MAGDHKCPVCEATFTRSQHVARHMRSHTGDRPYKCTHCGDQFARSDLLSRHVNKCHSTDGRPPPTPRRRAGQRASGGGTGTSSSQGQSSPTRGHHQIPAQVPTFSQDDSTSVNETSIPQNPLEISTLAPQPFQQQFASSSTYTHQQQQQQQQQLDRHQSTSSLGDNRTYRRPSSQAFGWPDSDTISAPPLDYTFPAPGQASTSSNYPRSPPSMPLYTLPDQSYPLPTHLPQYYHTDPYQSQRRSSATLMSALRGHAFRGGDVGGHGGSISDGNYSDISTSSASSSRLHIPLDYSTLTGVHSQTHPGPPRMDPDRMPTLQGHAMQNQLSGHDTQTAHPQMQNRQSQGTQNHPFSITHIPLDGGNAASGTGGYHPSVLAGLANDGHPFFSNQPSTATSSTIGDVPGAGSNSGYDMSGYGSISTGFTPKGLTPGGLAIQEDFWSTFMRDPGPSSGTDPGPSTSGTSTEAENSGGSGRPGYRSWNSGSTVVPSYQPRTPAARDRGGNSERQNEEKRPHGPSRQHSRSLPSIRNPGFADGVGRPEDHERLMAMHRPPTATTDFDALRSYEQAVLARKTPHLTFSPKKFRPRPTAEQGQWQPGAATNDQTRSTSRTDIPTSNARKESGAKSALGSTSLSVPGQPPEEPSHQQHRYPHHPTRVHPAQYYQQLESNLPTPPSTIPNGTYKSHGKQLIAASFDPASPLGSSGSGSSAAGSRPNTAADQNHLHRGPPSGAGLLSSSSAYNHPITFSPSLPSVIPSFVGEPTTSSRSHISRPTYKRLASQTLVPSTSKRALISKDQGGEDENESNWDHDAGGDGDDEGPPYDDLEGDDDPRPPTAGSSISVSSTTSSNLGWGNNVRRMSEPSNVFGPRRGGGGPRELFVGRYAGGVIPNMAPTTLNQAPPPPTLGNDSERADLAGASAAHNVHH